MKTIPVGHYRVKGLVALVDDDVYLRALSHNWTLQIRKTKTHGDVYYAKRTWREAGKLYSQMLHQFVLDVTPGAAGVIIDHKNQNPLDNQRNNLRVATGSQNNANKKPYGKSGYKGVFFVAEAPWHKWKASISVSGRTLQLGRFDSPVAAALAYDSGAERYFGEFAYLNFPKEVVY